MRATHSTDQMSIRIVLTLLLLIGFEGRAVAQSLEGDVAIRGYDSVAYFKAGEAVKGEESLSSKWHDRTWHFRSGENRDLFAANPEKYAPQYAGYCAWAMTEDRRAEPDPEIWKIINGKLYLNCSSEAYEKWSRDIPGNIKKADTHWSKSNSGN